MGSAPPAALCRLNMTSPTCNKPLLPLSPFLSRGTGGEGVGTGGVESEGVFSGNSGVREWEWELTSVGTRM
jgi:hypothetical protein